MKNMRIPTRPAPSAEEARRKFNLNQKRTLYYGYCKKKPPPRPPPPDFSKLKSKSAWNLNQPEKICLIEWSPPGSPKSSNRAYGGSISSSFSSSTSSLASSKKSFESDSPFNISPWTNSQTSSNFINNNAKREQTSQLGSVVPQISVPTIIRAQPSKKSKGRYVLSRDISPTPSTSREPTPPRRYSPPMPMIPPPSPPKDVTDAVIPFGIALYNFQEVQDGDLSLQENDLVILLHRINNEWLYGKIDDKEGMFPANFIDIQVPLEEDERSVTALYEFNAQLPGDLSLVPGQVVRVIRKISDEWLLGESGGQRGQFPANFINRIPTCL